MASPQEVLERAIPHPSDATPESRRSASTQVLRALAANEYHFMRRRHPVSEADDGECPACKREMVHVDHGDIYMDALQRMHAMGQRIARFDAVLQMIANGQGGDPAVLAQSVVST